MKDIPVNCIHALHPKSAQWLLWGVFLRDSQRGLKFWLAAGFEISEMPLAMLFSGNDAGLFARHCVLEQMKYQFSNLMFLPELIETEQTVYNNYAKICSDEFVRALRIIRSRFVLEEEQIEDPEDMDEQVLSMEIRTRAAILNDDVAWRDRERTRFRVFDIAAGVRSAPWFDRALPLPVNQPCGVFPISD